MTDDVRNASVQTRDSLIAFRAAIGAMPRYGEGERPMEWAARSMGAPDVAAPPPDASYLDGVKRRLLEAAREIGGIRAAASNRDLRDAPWLMWGAKDPLGAIPGLLEAVGVLARRRYSAATSLIDAWLMHFAPGVVGIEEAGHLIRRVLADNSDRRLTRWRTADKAFELFDARYGSRLVAAGILKAADPVSAILNLAGLDDPSRAVGGYARAVFAQALAQAPSAVVETHGQDRFARLREFLALDGKLRFGDVGAMKQIAVGLLAPWSNPSSPPDELRASTQGFLIHHLRDPRTHPTHWPPRESFEAKLMRRWMARASFQAFFDLIDETASDERFHERKAFWSAYLERDYVDDVWLALGSRIHSSARSVRDLNGAYARLKGSGGSHAILLLQMKDVVLCEWSIVGKLRAWPNDWKNAPRLGLDEYVRQDVVGRGLPFPATQRNRSGAPDGDGLSHMSGDTGRWQSSAAEFIRIRTGISLGPQHWMPK